MKNSNFKSIFLAIILVLGIFSCSNDDDSNDDLNNQITEEEASEIIETSLKSDTGGLTETTKSYSDDLENDITLNDLCNTLYNDTFSFSYSNNFVDAGYTVNWEYELTCNALNVPQSAVFSSTSSGTYNTQRISSNDTSMSSFNITGLQPSANAYTFNGQYKREGSQVFTTINQTRTFTSTLTVDISNITVDKVDYEIISGSGNATLNITMNNGNTFLFEGALTFNGNGTATLSLNGNTYTLTLNN